MAPWALALGLALLVVGGVVGSLVSRSTPSPSPAYQRALELHLGLVAEHQRDAYHQPQAAFVRELLELVRPSSRDYEEAQELLTRYRWEAERAPEVPTQVGPSPADAPGTPQAVEASDVPLEPAPALPWAAA